MARDNSAGFAALDEQIRRLRSLKAVGAEVAPKVAEALRTELESQIAEGVGPGGKPWKLTKAGKVPLRNAAAALSVKAVGSAVIARLTGPTALHHLGAAAGHIRRAILPTRKLPDRAVAAIKKVILQHFEGL